MATRVDPSGRSERSEFAGLFRGPEPSPISQSFTFLSIAEDGTPPVRGNRERRDPSLVTDVRDEHCTRRGVPELSAVLARRQRAPTVSRKASSTPAVRPSTYAGA
jgi:hypothetical protein